MSAVAEKPNIRRGQRNHEAHVRSDAPPLSPSHKPSAAQASGAGATNLPEGHARADRQIPAALGDSFNLRAHTRDFMDGRDASDMEALVTEWAKSLPATELRTAVQQVGREYLRQFILHRRSSSVRVGSPKWAQQADADPAGRLEDYLLAAPGGGFICVLDCTPEQLRYNAAMRRDQATAVLEEADRLDALADATEKANRKTPRTMNAKRVFEILVRGDDDE